MERSAYDRALVLLSAREHSRSELELKLSARGYSDEEISLALDRLEEAGLQSDRRFAECYIRGRLRRNPEGKGILVLRLREKGVDASLAREAVDGYFRENEEEIERIYTEYRDRLVSSKGEERARATLLRKGIRLTD